MALSRKSLRASSLLPLLLFAGLGFPLRAALARPLDEDQAFALAERVADNEDEADAKKALEELRKLGDEGVWDLLECYKVLEDEDDQETVKDAIVELGRDAIPELIRTVSDEKETDEDVLDCAELALQEIGPDVIPGLAHMVKDGTRVLRYRAAAILAQMDPESIPALVAIVKEGPKDPRDAAAAALGVIGPACVKPVVAILGSNKDARESARGVLMHVGLASPEAAKIVFKETVELLKSKSADLRGVAVSTVGKFGGAAAMPTIVDALCTDDEGVRRSAVECCALLGEPAIPDLVHCLSAADTKVADAAVDALTAIGDPAAPALLKLLKAPITQVRGCAACALGNMKHRPATPSLIELLDDTDETVKADAQEALEGISGEKLKDKAAWSAWWEKHKDDAPPRSDDAQGDDKKDANK